MSFVSSQLPAFQPILPFKHPMADFPCLSPRVPVSLELHDGSTFWALLWYVFECQLPSSLPRAHPLPLGDIADCCFGSSDSPSSTWSAAQAGGWQGTCCVLWMVQVTHRLPACQLSIREISKQPNAAQGSWEGVEARKAKREWSGNR